jgi:hypothetical protein
MHIRTKNKILAVATSVAAIFVPALLLGKVSEGVVFFFCHWLIREQFPKQYHHIIPSMCRLITSVVFFFGVSFVLPFSLSIFSAIPINYFIAWVGYTKKQCDDYEYKYEQLKAQIEKDHKFSVDNCTKEQLLARCRELGMSKENTDLAVELFVDKVSRKELAQKHFITEDGIKVKKRRMKEKLNKD